MYLHSKWGNIDGETKEVCVWGGGEKGVKILILCDPSVDKGHVGTILRVYF